MDINKTMDFNSGTGESQYGRMGERLDQKQFRRFIDQARPRMLPENVVQGDRWRIGVLAPSLLRLEWSDSGEFEDGISQMVVNRQFGGQVDFHVTRAVGGDVVIDTEALHLVYDGKKFSKEGLSVVVKGVPGSQFNTWHFGDAGKGNLKGTARTLDEADGAIPLDDGVLSRDGWAVIDDSASGIIGLASPASGGDDFHGEQGEHERGELEQDEHGQDEYGQGQFGPGIEVNPRSHQEIDLYFFGYGLRFVEAVQGFYGLTGAAPLLPRFALGNWWSRFYPYSQASYGALMDRFAKAGIPFSVAVIDMDWHRVDVPARFGSGWTGYSWNRRLFPDPQGFLSGLHERGLRTTLNVHPRDGVRAFEDCYPAMARTMGVDPSAESPIEFDLTDPRFVDAYFAMHHGFEDEGVDFWWVDWQQGGVSRRRGVDPLWLLNHLHYVDSGRGGRWPLTFSRYAGPGSHRYPVGFSGDTVISWDSLRFQPYFTATASNIGYGWWSHDIGGHMLGARDDELEVRWYQWGVFSPVNRLHSSASAFSGKEPWNFPGDAQQVMIDFLRLRHRMVPYLYSMDYRAHEQGLPLVEPVYWWFPQVADAYLCQNEYFFGDRLLVSPIVEKADASSLMGGADVWLPRGIWFDVFTGRRYLAACDRSGEGLSTGAAGRRVRVHRPLGLMPVFARAGAVVPLQDLTESGSASTVNDLSNPQRMTVMVFPGADGDFLLREDSGRLGSDGRPSGRMTTTISAVWDDGPGHRRKVVIGPAIRRDGDDQDKAEDGDQDDGRIQAIPQARTWTVTWRGVGRLDENEVTATVGGRPVDGLQISYDEDKLSLTVTLPACPTSGEVVLIFPSDLDVAPDPYLVDCQEILAWAQMPYLTKDLAWSMVQEVGAAALSGLRTLNFTGGVPGEKEISQEESKFASSLPESVLAALEEVLLR